MSELRSYQGAVRERWGRVEGSREGGRACVRMAEALCERKVTAESAGRINARGGREERERERKAADEKAGESGAGSRAERWGLQRAV